MDTITIGAAIVGLINLVQKQYPKVSGLYGVVLAVVLGAAAGYFGLQGLTVETGILAGLGSSGLYKLATKVGGQ